MKLERAKEESFKFMQQSFFFFLNKYIMSLWDSFLQVLEVPCHSTSQDSLDNKNSTTSLVRPNDL